MLLTVVINTHRRRDVAVWDIPGAYLSDDMDEEVIMVLEGRLEELTEIVEP